MPEYEVLTGSHKFNITSTKWWVNWWVNKASLTNICFNALNNNNVFK